MKMNLWVFPPISTFCNYLYELDSVQQHTGAKWDSSVLQLACKRDEHLWTPPPPVQINSALIKIKTKNTDVKSETNMMRSLWLQVKET